ncbi:hypothetical protein IHE61_04345 [Streptomyces sp. GKU 257-1]|nr:hypothetical protein [Streptomyces sp. GKU 257-1]
MSRTLQQGGPAPGRKSDSGSAGSSKAGESGKCATRISSTLPSNAVDRCSPAMKASTSVSSSFLGFPGTGLS